MNSFAKLLCGTLAIVMMAGLTACNDKVPVVVTSDGTAIKNYHIGNNGLSEPTFNYVQVDGHQYLMYFNANNGGITHSPKCDYLKKEKE